MGNRDEPVAKDLYHERQILRLSYEDISTVRLGTAETGHMTLTFICISWLKNGALCKRQILCEKWL